MIIAQISIQKPSDFEQIQEVISSECMSRNLMNQFKDVLSEKIKTVLVEYPYVDKDYRSTFYAFYSKRHRSYNQFCYRIHFFGRYPVMENLEKSQDSYMGSMVLRPTEITPLGRTLIAPEAIKNFTGFVCEAEFQNNIMGLPFPVQTFPLLVARVFMTSSRSYKRKIHSYAHMPRDMRSAQLELPMPKFIWLVELSTPAHYDNNLVDYRFIVDSTANQYEPRSFLFIHDKHKMLINDRALTGKTYECNFDTIISPFELYTNNLKWRSA